MKIKNIMFSGVMASILMVGGASADISKLTSAGNSTKLTTEAFVRGGIMEAENYADQQINALKNGEVAANTAAIGTKANAATSTEASGLYKYIDDEVAAAKNAVAGESGSLNDLNEGLKDSETLVEAINAVDDKANDNADAIGDLEELVGDTAVATQITNAVGELDVASLSASGSGVAVSLSETDGKIGNLTASIESKGVKTANIDDKAVTNDQLSDAVNASLAKADSAIQATNLATASAVGVVKVDDDTIGAADDGTISVKDGSITYEKIATEDLATTWGI